MADQAQKDEFKVRISITHKIVLYTTLLIFIVVGISTYLAMKRESKVLSDSLANMNKHMARQISFSAKKAFWSVSWILVEKMLEEYKCSYREMIYAKIVKPNGEIYMADNRKCYGDMVDSSLLYDQETLHNNYFFSETEEYGMLLVYPFTIGNERWYTILGISLKSIHKVINDLIIRNTIWGSIIVLLGIIGSFLLSKSISKPLIGLANATRILSSGDLDHRVSIASKDEVGLLSYSFNRMVDSLKQAEEKLRNSETQKKAILDASIDSIRLVDKDMRIIWANQTTTTEMNIAPEALIGKFCYESFFGIDTPCAECPTKKALESGKTEHSVLYQSKSKRIKAKTYWDSYAVPIKNETNDIENIIQITRNITERMQVENALRERTEALEISNRELEQFAYVASHDLQEPLRMISSYVQLLARRYKDRLDTDADEFISYAVDGVTRMQVLINDLLAYSRVTTRGKDFEATDSEEALSRALRNLQAAIQESSAVMTYDPLPTVMTDSIQLEQLFQNLISNSIKFRSNEPPHVHISAQRINNSKPSIEQSLRDGWLFSVCDNGIGIDPEYADRIFTIFQRLHTRDEYPGTGIGLAICKRIVERHRGRIWVESQLGQGAIFNFSIPMSGGENDDQ